MAEDITETNGNTQPVVAAILNNSLSLEDYQTVGMNTLCEEVNLLDEPYKLIIYLIMLVSILLVIALF